MVCRLQCEEANPDVTCRQPAALEYIHADISSNHTVSALEGRNRRRRLRLEQLLPFPLDCSVYI